MNQFLTCLLCLCILKSTQQAFGQSLSAARLLKPQSTQLKNSNNNNGDSAEGDFRHFEKPGAYLDGSDDDGFGDEIQTSYFPKLRPFSLMDIYSKASEPDAVAKIPKQTAAIRTTRIKRSPTGFTARGFHEGAFDRDFGHFSPVKRSHKRKPEADSSGFYGDTFSNGFGEFETMKRISPQMSEAELMDVLKRKPMGASGFHGDTFSSGFGDFDTMKRRYPYNNWADKTKKNQEMGKSGFYGDVFSGGFGEFNPM